MSRQSLERVTAEQLAQLFHDSFMKIAPKYDKSRYYMTGSRGWDEIPTISRRLLIEISQDIINSIDWEDPFYPPKKKL
jgi:methyl coenzyme M reductase gamma subunit